MTLTIAEQFEAKAHELHVMQQHLIQAILDLPDNPNVHRTGEGGLTINASLLQNNWSPGFHDFKMQYALIADKIIMSNDCMQALQRILTVGRIDRIKLHPGVCACVRELINGPGPEAIASTTG